MALPKITNTTTLLRLILILTLALAAIALFGHDKIATAQDLSSSAPTITSISIVSDPNTADTTSGVFCHPSGWERSRLATGYYIIGDTIELAVEFDQGVTIAGSPTLTFDLESSAERTASYARTDDKKVVFSYEVQAGDASANGISVSADSIALGDQGAIKNTADTAANLTHSALATQTGHKVDGVAPTISRSEIMLSTRTRWKHGDERYAQGDVIMAMISFSERVVHATGNPASVKLQIGDDQKIAGITCERTQGVVVNFGSDDLSDAGLMFEYTVQEGDYDAGGVDLVENSLTIPTGGFIKDLAGNDLVVTTHAGDETPHQVDGVPPMLKRARTTQDGSKVVFVFDEETTLTHGIRSKRKMERRPIGDFLVEAFGVRVDGVEVAASGARRSSTKVVIILENSIQAGQTVEVNYVNRYEDDDNIKGVISDRYQNPVNFFSWESAKNKVSP